MHRDDNTTNGPALADGLRTWATGSYCAEAAVNLLVEHGTWLSRPEFQRQAVWIDAADGGCGDATRTVVGIDWGAAADVLASAPASASERRVLALAICLADGDAHPVDLGDALCSLDRRTRHSFFGPSLTLSACMNVTSGSSSTEPTRTPADDQLES